MLIAHASCQVTKPPGMLRQAEPLPSLASAESSPSVLFMPRAAHAARVSAAKPEADEAMPTPMGKVLFDTTRALGRLWIGGHTSHSPESVMRSR